MIRYILYALAALLFDLFVWLTAWLWAIPPAVLKLDRLPCPFGVVHTHDDDIYGSKTTREPIPATVWGRWKRATWWMLRNPGYGLQAYVLGIRAEKVMSVVSHGEIETGIHDDFLLYAETPGEEPYRFGYRHDLRYKTGGKRYCKLWFGWGHAPKAGYHLLKIDINPFKKDD